MRSFKVVARVTDKGAGTVAVWHGGDEVYIYDGLMFSLDADPTIIDTIVVQQDRGRGADARPEIVYPQDVVRVLEEYVHDRDCEVGGRFQDCHGDFRCPLCDYPCGACGDQRCGVFE